MPINRAAQDVGTFTSEEVSLFWRIFDATKGEAENQEDKERRASRIIANYMAGITDEGELIELSRKPLRR